MTLAVEQAKAEKALVWLFEAELVYRIEGKAWTQADAPNTACWWMAHLTEGEPSRVYQLLRSTHVIGQFTERATLALCQSNASSWYYDASNGRLYVHMSDGDSPATASKYYLRSHFWERAVTHQYPMPDTIYDPAGRFIKPRLIIRIPEYSQEVNDFQKAGDRETWSSVLLENGDGYYDAKTAAYVWTMCLFYLKAGARGDAIANYTTVIRGRTGSLGWRDQELEVRTEDQIKAED